LAYCFFGNVNPTEQGVSAGRRSSRKPPAQISKSPNKIGRRLLANKPPANFFHRKAGNGRTRKLEGEPVLSRLVQVSGNQLPMKETIRVLAVG
jgi:hypothetical protein